MTSPIKAERRVVVVIRRGWRNYSTFGAPEVAGDLTGSR
jgi:hypothetical protein